MEIEKVLQKEITFPKLEEVYFHKVKSNWDQVAKPLDSMGKFESIFCQIGMIQKNSIPNLNAELLVFCADNGIVEEGISQSGQEVTRICAESIASGKSSVSVMASVAGVAVNVYDVGINTNEKLACANHKKVMSGTNNFLKEPAMSKEQTLRAMQIGYDLVREKKEQGIGILCVGEMGIGNTTTSAAVASALLNVHPDVMTGKGAGLSDEGLARKKQVVLSGIEKYDLEHKSPLEVLSCVGGLDLAAMVGVYVGGRMFGMPIILDGVITMVAALVAEKLLPESKKVLIPSHASREPAVKKIVDDIKLTPAIYADMALGEGSGAIMFYQLIKLADEVYKNSNPFQAIGVKQYTRK